MLKLLIPKIIIPLTALSIIGAALAQSLMHDKPLVSRLMDYIDENAQQSDIALRFPPRSDIRKDEDTDFGYIKGDWQRSIIEQKYQMISDGINEGTYRVRSEDDVELISYGAMKMNFLYGHSAFTSSKYKQYDEDKPVSKVIQSGFHPEHETQIHAEGRIGDRMTVFIDHDNRKKDNHYVMKYRAINDDEVIREINAGEIDIKLENSKYAVYDDTVSKGMGMDMTIKKDKLKLKGFGSVLRGEIEIETFKGNSAANSIKLAEYQYLRTTYYQLEPFKRYDNRDSPPSPTEYANLITFTSSPPNPAVYTPWPVGIDPGGFELYIDDQNPLNKASAVRLNIDNGLYNKMVFGTDYTVNFSTGLITILKGIARSSRIFAVYTRSGGTQTSDPSARSDVFPGKLFVFIKYGYSINEDLNGNGVLDPGEDRNNDGRLNMDIYEVRSFYRIGDRQLSGENFKAQFLRDNGIISGSDAAKTGRYAIDYTNGIMRFNLREPFRPLLSNLASKIYGEIQLDSVSVFSLFQIKIDYYREARSFQLKHINIIPESLRVKVNGAAISASLFTVDYVSGYFQFINPDNPLITHETDIEIRYEFLPFAGQSQSFVGGFRGDYALNRNLNLGGTLLYSHASAGQMIPRIGSEPGQTLLTEGDVKLALPGKSIAKLMNHFLESPIRDVPVDIMAYGEYAKSSRVVNTFGKALIDDMESTEEITLLSMSEKDWILSSMPAGYTQANRGQLNYLFYRDINHAEDLRGLDFSPIAVPYSVKPGPYNVATGHIPGTIQDDRSQRSLALNFDFGSGTCIPICTRKLSSDAVDFSSLQYIELWYRSGGGTGEVEIGIDVGRISEDTDGDGVLDTEDLNHNGVLDIDPANNYFEDRGYRFNPSGMAETVVGGGPRLSGSTMGDGILNTEDLNGNGMLDAVDRTVTVPGDITLPYMASNPLIVSLPDTTWKKARIYLDKSASAYAANPSYYEEILKQVQSIRLYVKKRGSTNTGIVYLNGLRFVSSRWKTVKLDSRAMDSPKEFRITTVDTLSDDDYRAESFMIKESAVYQSLYGQKNQTPLDRERESALLIEYDLTGRSKGSVTRRFARPIDLRFYRTMNMWFNYRRFTSGDIVGVTIGSSDTDYIEYRFPMDALSLWREAQLRLSDDSTGTVGRHQTAGSPDMKRISYIEIAVYGKTGALWADDIYVSSPQTLKDSAYWYEAELKINKPLFRTKTGIPILSDIAIKYIEKGHGSQFATVGKTVSDVKERYRELFSSMNIFPNWSTQLSFISEESKTDNLNEQVNENKRGQAGRKSLFMESNYTSTESGVPSIKLSYKYDQYMNSRDEITTSQAWTRQTKTNYHTPTVLVEEKIDNFFAGNLTTSVMMDLFYKKETIKKTPLMSMLAGETTAETIENEKRQRGKATLTVDYQNRLFFVTPSIEMSSQEIVETQGKSGTGSGELQSDVSGGFHAPFMYSSSARFVERNKRAGFRCGMQKNLVIAPEMKIDLAYFENRFRDYDQGERLLFDRFTRSRDASTSIGNRVDIPLNLYHYDGLKWMRSLNLSYSRNLAMQETAIPYEGEGISAFDESFGLRRAYNGLADPGINLLRYPPWYFFTGRGNFGRGRDFAHGTLNGNLVLPNGNSPSEYNNNLRLIENISLASTLDFEKADINWGGGINEINERQAIRGIPQQVVSFNQFININMDLMRIFSIGFFRPNRSGLPHHGANYNIGYTFTRNMLVTSNIEEDVHSITNGIMFKRDRSSIGVKGGIDLRFRQKHEYIPFDDARRNRLDDIYIDNMQNRADFHEYDKGYNISVLYETDVLWLYHMFEGLYKLIAYPIFSLEYSLILNRYDYLISISPEPYDQHLITGKLTLDLHKNIQGGIIARWALEKFRNRESSAVYREIQSYEVGMNFSLLF